MKTQSRQARQGNRTTPPLMWPGALQTVVCGLQVVWGPSLGAPERLWIIQESTLRMGQLFTCDSLAEISAEATVFSGWCVRACVLACTCVCVCACVHCNSSSLSSGSSVQLKPQLGNSFSLTWSVAQAMVAAYLMQTYLPTSCT